MTDVRALLAAERQSRRIQHSHLTYSSKGALTCNVCDLNVKSEQLWPGHLKSLNHRKNVQRLAETGSRPGKRKLDDVEEARPAKRKIDDVEEEEPERNYEVDSRKKPKATPRSQQEIPAAVENVESEYGPAVQPESEAIMDVLASAEPADTSNTDVQPTAPQPDPPDAPAPIENTEAVDEDEWAAFEREMAAVEQPNYASATIEAAPVSASDIAEQQKRNPIQLREDEAEGEKEDEERRMEEEFEVMEEMEDRVKRLRERREALRTKDPAQEGATMNGIEELSTIPEEVEGEEPSDDDDVDDWYG